MLSTPPGENRVSSFMSSRKTKKPLTHKQLLTKIILRHHLGTKMKNNISSSLSLLISLLLFAIGCNTTEPPIIPPPPDLRKITLTFEESSCTEVWLTVKADSITLPAQLTLKQYNTAGDSLSQIFVLNTKDSVLYFDSLLPNQNYNYWAVLIADTTIKSEKVTAQTLEPTSHNFTWQTFEFGQHSSSVLYDVAIIDENNIWAVGEIFMNDSLGNPDPKRYNAAFWNGIGWTVKRIPYFYQGQQFYNPIYSIYTFSINDIWFCGNGVIHWNGSQYLPVSIPTSVWGPYNMNKLWGTSSNDMYVVGNEGNIAHYNNGTWTKIESGTTLHLTDIYGDNKGNIYTAGIDIPNIKGVVVKNRTTNQWNVMIEGEVIDESQLFTKLFGSFGAIWVDEIGTVYTGGDFLYQFKNKKWDFVRTLPENYLGGDQYYIGYLYSIRGNKSNDIILAGDRNTLRHFNGIEWSEIGIPYLPTQHIFWRSVQMKGKLAIAVGDEGIKAKIIMLNR